MDLCSNPHAGTDQKNEITAQITKVSFLSKALQLHVVVRTRSSDVRKELRVKEGRNMSAGYMQNHRVLL